MRRSATFKLVTSVAIAVGVTLLAWGGLSAGTFQNTQLRLSDSLFGQLGVDDRIVVVGIDDATLAELGRFPFDRSYHAQLITALDRMGAHVVGYDVGFPEPNPQAPESDAELAAAVQEAGNVVMVAEAELEGRIGDVPRASDVQLPIPEIAEGAGLAHPNVIPDPDRIVRTLPLVVDTPGGDLLPALSFVLYQAEEGLAGPPTLRPEGVQVADRVIPTGEGHLLDVNFPNRDDLPVLSFIDVLQGNVPEEAIRDKIVLVGATEADLGDVEFTPVSEGREPGVFIHADALNTMLTGAFLEREGTPITLLWVFVLALLAAVAVAYLRIWLSPIVALGVVAAFAFLGFMRFDNGTVMNLAYPPLALILSFLAALAVRYLTEERERRRVTQVFGRYVAKDVVDEVLAAPQNALATLDGAERSLSMLFADLRGFTSASEDKRPAEVVAALNAYLDAMTRAVNEEMGTVDKFMGDCVMAFWGAPRPTENHAERAARAGIKMLDYIDEAVQKGDTAGLNVAGCGVGIATGPAVVGNIGSAERLDYTVIGDTVNTASRICGVAGAGQVVITQETKDALGEEFRIGPLPPLVVKGKVEPLAVYEVLREGQEAKEVAEGATLDATEDKGHFEPTQTAPETAASYAPVEPAEPIEASDGDVPARKPAAQPKKPTRKAPARKPAAKKATARKSTARKTTRSR